MLVQAVKERPFNTTWHTKPIPFKRGVFEGIHLLFQLPFNPLLKLAESLNNSYGYYFKLLIEGSESIPPLNNVKWTESENEPSGWYKACIDEYFWTSSTL